MFGGNKKGGWIGIGAGLGTAIAVANDEPTWIAAGIAFGSLIILLSAYLYPSTSSDINKAVEKFEKKQ